MTLKEIAAHEDVAELTAPDIEPCRPPRRPRRRRAAANEVAPQAQAKTVCIPTRKEIAAAGRIIERLDRADTKSQMFFDFDREKKKVVNTHPDQLISQLSLMDSFATSYVHVSDALLQQLITICGKGGQDPDGRELSQAVAMVQAIAPQDETEAMLAVQMVAVHKATMTAASRLGQVQADANVLIKLTRTFTAQIDALRNWRLKGTQVIHVYHHRGDTLLEPPGAAAKSKEQPHGPYGPTECRSPLRGEIEAIAADLPRPCREGR